MSQTVSITGSGNTIVQVTGDGNTIVPGCPHLTLTRYAAQREVRTELGRLSPYSRSTPLFGREAVLESLRDFLDAPRSAVPGLAARVIIGGGGSGKTRLALELCEEVAAQGWQAGFVTRTELKRFFAQQNLSEWGWQKPTLVVVDYAAEHAQLLGDWLSELTDRAAPSHPLRLLLLERHADMQTGWWTTVFASGGYGDALKRGLLDPPEPVELAPLDQLSRLALLRAMAPALPADAATDDALRAALGQPEWGGDPLFLIMAATIAADLGTAQALTLNRPDLAHAVARREAKRLRELAAAQGLGPALVLHLAACVTLAQGMSTECFLDFAAAEKAACHRPDGGDPAALATCLMEALPRPEGIAPVQPDLIGEALVLEAMKGVGAGTPAVCRCHAAFGQAVAESAIRCALDFASDAAPMQWLAGVFQAIRDDEAALAALQGSLPIHAVRLRDFNLEVAGRLSTLLANRADATPGRRAAALHNLAVSQSLAGQREAALASSQAATEMLRALAEQAPEVVTPQLAQTLGNLASNLSDLGHPERALAAAQEAVDRYRALATQRPEVFGRGLAGALNNLACNLSDLGHRKSALAAAQEAVEGYRGLFAARPEVFRPDLATAINTLANCLSKLGHLEPALTAAREAVDLDRALFAARPEVFGPDLAQALNNLSNRLSELNDLEPALAAAREAVERYRALAAARPEVFQPNLARALNSLAIRLSELGDREAALAAAEEATMHCRTLAEQRPEVFQPDLAPALNTLSNLLGDLGQARPALAVIEEAVDLFRVLFAARPEVFRPDLARALGCLANRLGACGHAQAALAAAQEATEHHRALYAARPEVFRPDLAFALNTLASRLSESGQHEPALATAEEAAMHCRALAEQRPDVFLPDLATVLNNLANRLNDCGHAERALAAIEEAVEHYRALFAARPEVFRPALAKVLGNLANRLSDCGHPEPALAAIKEAVDLYRALFAVRPEVFRPDLARALILLALHIWGTADATQALPPAHEAVYTLTPAFLAQPETHAQAMTRILKSYLNLCEAAGQAPDGDLLAPLMPYISDDPPPDQGDSSC